MVQRHPSVARSDGPRFNFAIAPCTTAFTAVPEYIDTDIPAVSEAFYYLARPGLFVPGSWGAASDLTPRAVFCF